MTEKENENNSSQALSPSSPSSPSSSPSSPSTITPAYSLQNILIILRKFLQRYCCCCGWKCCQKYFTEKIFPNDINEFESTEHDIPSSRPKEIGDQYIIKKFVQKWEGKFWNKFWKNHGNSLLKRLAATKIQAIVRGYLGRRRYERQYARATYEMNEFWRRKRELKLLEKEKQRIAKEVREKMSSQIARNTLAKCVAKKARRDGALTIQRAWRGMVGRCIAAYFLMLAKQLRIPKPKSPPSRFKAEVFRRIWARKAFVPEGGWPGKADFKEFDMWDHIYTPPKGNKYGLKTHKVRHILEEKDKELMMNDKNSWIGMPIGVKEPDNASISSSKSQSYSSFRLESSPYQNPVIKHDHSINKPKRPTGLKLLDSLGWKNPLTEQRQEKTKSESLASSGVFPERKSYSPENSQRVSSPNKQSPLRNSSFPMKSPTKTIQVNPRSIAEDRVSTASQAIEREQRKLGNTTSLFSNSPKKQDASFLMTTSADFAQNSTMTFSRYDKDRNTGPLIKGKLFDDDSQILNYSSTLDTAGRSPTRGTTKPRMGHPVTVGETTKQLTNKGLSVQQLAREKEKELFALTHSPKNSARGFSSVPSNDVKDHQVSGQSSKWNTMKTSLLQKTPHSSDKKRERAERLEKRKRPWPMPTSEHYQMEYSWLAQPMVAEAARQVFYEEKEAERQKAAEEERIKKEMEEKERKLTSTFLQRVKKYNPQDVSGVNTLGNLREYEKETAHKIREERLNAKPLKHPYGWSMPNANNSITS